MEYIEEQIQKSREREANGVGPCKCVDESQCHCETTYGYGLETWEPRFRDAFEYVVAQMRAAGMHRELEKAERILRGRS